MSHGRDDLPSDELKPVARPVRRRRWLKRIALGLLVVAFTGFAVFWWYCSGPGSMYGLLKKYEQPYRAKNDQLKRLGANLPPVGDVQTDECRNDLNPRPLYNARELSGNCEIAMESSLREHQYGEVQLGPSIFLDTEIGLNKAVYWYRSPGMRYWNWYGPPMSDRVERELKLGLEQVYLVVLRPRIYDPFEKTADGKTTGGGLELECLLFDLRTEEKVGQLIVRATPASKFKVRENKMAFLDEESDLAFSARLSMEVVARERLMTKLEELTGGEFSR